MLRLLAYLFGAPLYGDSHAHQYYDALVAVAASAPGPPDRRAGLHALPGIVNVYQAQALERTRCIDRSGRTFAMLLLGNWRPIYWVIAYRWSKDLVTSPGRPNPSAW